MEIPPVFQSYKGEKPPSVQLADQNPIGIHPTLGVELATR
jgi:hypothetical protein